MGRPEVVGSEEVVPLLGGGSVRYANLDHAATTPPLRAVADAVDRFLPLGSSVHRGTGHKSRLSTEVYEQARRQVGDFVGADPDRDVVVFTTNTTEAINRLARSLAAPPGSVVVTTLLEHHSNDLPWRARGATVHVGVQADGTLDLDDLQRLLTRHAGRVALLAVSGASNVTGVVPPVHRLAEMVHAVGGRILVDAAQLAPHRPIDLLPHDDPGHLDLVALSGHKLYAPYGSGALIGPRDAFTGEPDHPGGGTVRLVTPDEVVWADLPQRAEPGSPNVVGAVALAAATVALRGIGLDRIAAHESRLAAYALEQLASVPGLVTYGPDPGSAVDRLGVIPFNLGDEPHARVAAVLGYEHGIGVRDGCFCAQPYVARLLGLSEADLAVRRHRARRGDERSVPGMVRLSLGCANDAADVDRLVDGLRRVATGDVLATYVEDEHGAYRPTGHPEPLLPGLAELLHPSPGAGPGATAHGRGPHGDHHGDHPVVDPLDGARRPDTQEAARAHLR